MSEKRSCDVYQTVVNNVWHQLGVTSSRGSAIYRSVTLRGRPSTSTVYIIRDTSEHARNDSLLCMYDTERGLFAVRPALPCVSLRSRLQADNVLVSLSIPSRLAECQEKEARALLESPLDVGYMWTLTVQEAIGVLTTLFATAVAHRTARTARTMGSLTIFNAFPLERRLEGGRHRPVGPVLCRSETADNDSGSGKGKEGYLFGLASCCRTTGMSSPVATTYGCFNSAHNLWISVEDMVELKVKGDATAWGKLNIGEALKVKLPQNYGVYENGERPFVQTSSLRDVLGDISADLFCVLCKHYPFCRVNLAGDNSCPYYLTVDFAEKPSADAVVTSLTFLRYASLALPSCISMWMCRTW